MKFFFLLIAAFTFSLTQAQSPDIPDEANNFLIPPMGVLDYITGDLNGDKRPDAIMILKMPGEDTIMDETMRPMLILIRQADGKLKQVARNDNAILCRQCGGVMGNPYEGVKIKNNGFNISFYGGSSWRWSSDYLFSYKPLKKNWYLVKESQSSFQAGDPETTTHNTAISEVELGEISFEKFNSEPAYEETKWTVTAAKTFFYDSPKLGSTPRKAYLLKGNTAKAIRQFTHFIEVSFENPKGDITTGYILRKDLAPVK